MAVRPSASHALGRPARQTGFTYLGLLFFVALSSAGLAALGNSWQMAAQRERERELEFRGNEIAKAIASYVKASPVQPGQYPQRFEDLLVDRRAVKPRHHLRRLYLDPFTGKPDWVLVKDETAAPVFGTVPTLPGAQPWPSSSSAALTAASFSAVRSRSDHALQRESQANGEPLRRASDWLFSARQFEEQQQQAQAPTAVPPPPTSPTEPGSGRP
nr:hypothetical protein [uncultured Roseateles sp.]